MASKKNTKKVAVRRVPTSPAPSVRSPQRVQQSAVSSVVRPQTSDRSAAPVVARVGIQAVEPREQKALPPQPKRRQSFSVWKYIAASLIGVCLLGGAVLYFVVDTQTPEQKKEAYIQSIVADISTKVLIPPGETPTIGVIPDPIHIQENKEFFKNASQGDYLVVFPHARLMLIYSPQRKVVIHMGYAPETPAETVGQKIAPATSANKIR